MQIRVITPPESKALYHNNIGFDGNMRITTAIAFALAATPALADPLMIKGYGQLSCGQVLSQNGFTSEGIVSWIGGYATAAENYTKIFEILPDAPHDTMGVVRIVQQQCEAFPKKTLFLTKDKKRQNDNPTDGSELAAGENA